MAIWKASDVRVGEWVRDTSGEFGTGQVTGVEPYGCDITWKNGNKGFLGLGWLVKVVPPKVVQKMNESLEFEFDIEGTLHGLSDS